MSACQSTCAIDNDRVRVTRWTLPPNASTGMHTHEFDYVITPVCDGQVSILEADGNTRLFEMNNGNSYFREVGVTHDLTNIGAETLEFVEVELKETRR